MIRLEQCDPVLSASICEEVIELFELHPSLFAKRSQHVASVGTSGGMGHYYSLCHDAAPENVRSWLGLLAPKLQGLTLDRAHINMYPPGSHVSPYSDGPAPGSLAMAVVALQRHPMQGVTWYDCNNPSQGHLIPDELGQAVIFCLGTLHSVATVVDRRCSIAFLYS